MDKSFEYLGVVQNDKACGQYGEKEVFAFFVIERTWLHLFSLGLSLKYPHAKRLSNSKETSEQAEENWAKREL